MTERRAWKNLRDRLKPHGRLIRVENAAMPGTPDVCYCLHGVTGWLELKYLPKLPKRPVTPVVIPSLTIEQVQWLLAWEGVGGEASLYLRVGRNLELLLTPHQVMNIFRGNVRSLDIGQLTRGFGNAHVYRAANAEDIVAWLMRRKR